MFCWKIPTGKGASAERYGGFNSGLSDFTGWAYLNTGANTVYMQVDDTGGQTATLVGPVDVKFEAIPEPSSFVLLGVGAAGVAFLRRKAGKK